MRRRSTLPCVLLIGGLAGCGAATSRGDAREAELGAWNAEAQAMREHAELVELRAHVSKMERRLANQKRACEGTPNPQSTDVARAHTPTSPKPLRSQGDFQAEARVAPPTAGPPAARVDVGGTPQPADPASERERLEQLLEGLREYVFDPRSGLSIERREALRVLLRRDRQLDLMNPWIDR